MFGLVNVCFPFFSPISIENCKKTRESCDFLVHSLFVELFDRLYFSSFLFGVWWNGLKALRLSDKKKGHIRKVVDCWLSIVGLSICKTMLAHWLVMAMDFQDMANILFCGYNDTSNPANNLTNHLSHHSHLNQPTKTTYNHIDHDFDNNVHDDDDDDDCNDHWKLFLVWQITFVSHCVKL